MFHRSIYLLVFSVVIPAYGAAHKHPPRRVKELCFGKTTRALEISRRIQKDSLRINGQDPSRPVLGQMGRITAKYQPGMYGIELRAVGIGEGDIFSVSYRDEGGLKRKRQIVVDKVSLCFGNPEFSYAIGSLLDAASYTHHPAAPDIKKRYLLQCDFRTAIRKLKKLVDQSIQLALLDALVKANLNSINDQALNLLEEIVKTDAQELDFAKLKMEFIFLADELEELKNEIQS